MLQSTFAQGTRLAHNQRLIDRRNLRGKARARAMARVNAKQTPTCTCRWAAAGARQTQGLQYPLYDDSFWATDEDEDDPELDLELIQGPSIAHPPRTVRRPRLAPPAAPPPPSGRRARNANGA
jgi:hypothetical protein